MGLLESYVAAEQARRTTPPTFDLGEVKDWLRSLLTNVGGATQNQTGESVVDVERRVRPGESPGDLLARLGINDTVAEQAALIKAEDVARKPTVNYIDRANQRLRKQYEGESPQDLLARLGIDEKTVAEQAALIEAEDNDIRSLVANKSTNAINEGARAAAKANIRKRENLLSQAMDKVKEDEVTVARSLLGDGPVTSGIDTLLGKIDWRYLLSIIGNPAFSAALMQPGISPAQAIAGGIGAARQNLAAAASAEREARLKEYEAETKRIDAQGATPPKLTAEVNKMYDRIESSRRISRIGNKIKIALEKSPFVTGGPGEGAKAVRAIAAALGISPGVFTTDDVKKNIAKLKGEVLKSKTFGREASRQELEEILNKILADPGMFTTSDQLIDSVDSMMRDAERDIYNTTARMKAYGLHISTDENPMSMQEKYFKRNTGANQ